MYCHNFPKYYIELLCVLVFNKGIIVHYMNFIRLVFLIISISFILSCSNQIDRNGFVLIDPEENPQLLPFQFIEFRSNNDLTCPIILDNTGRVGTYTIQNNWVPIDTLTAIVFRDFSSDQGVAINQENIKTREIIDYRSVSFDKEVKQNLIILYRNYQDLVFEIIDPTQGSFYKKTIVTGKDNNGNGRWDGIGGFSGEYDINGDTYKEILITIYTGYDLYPRALCALDWHNDTLLWRFDVAGGAGSAKTIYTPDSLLLFFGCISPGNGAVWEDMDDAHTYLVSIDSNGDRRWFKETGGSLSRARVELFDYSKNDEIDILADYYRIKEDNTPAEGLVVFNQDGKALDSVTFEGIIESYKIIDLDSDGKNEVVVTIQDNTVWLLDDQLNLIHKYRYSKSLRIEKIGSFLNNNEKQLLCRSSDGSHILFTSKFNPIALLNVQGDPYITNSNDYGSAFLFADTSGTSMFYLKSTPWTKEMYLRYKNQILIIGISLLVGLFTSFFYQRRTKSNLNQIAKQKNELEVTHEILKDTQDKLIAAEKYAQAKDIAGGFAHEIRNALFPAKSWLSKLKKTAENDSQKDQIKYTDQAVTRAISITNSISQYTKLEAERNIEEVDIESIFNTTIEANMPRINEMNIHLKTSGHLTSKAIANIDQLCIVFNNLMINSLDALTDSKIDGIISISYKENDNFITIIFNDNGCGIPDENLKNIFDPFFSTKPPHGTGLGLSMSKKILENYDGSISVTSKVGQGTTFTVKLKSTEVINE